MKNRLLCLLEKNLPCSFSNWLTSHELSWLDSRQHGIGSGWQTTMLIATTTTTTTTTDLFSTWKMDKWRQITFSVGHISMHICNSRRRSFSKGLQLRQSPEWHYNILLGTKEKYISNIQLCELNFEPALCALTFTTLLVKKCGTGTASWRACYGDVSI